MMLCNICVNIIQYFEWQYFIELHECVYDVSQTYHRKRCCGKRTKIRKVWNSYLQRKKQTVMSR